MGQLFIKRLTFTFLLAACSLVLAFKAQAIDEHVAEDKGHQSHQGHSDDLLLLLRHKIALQKLQQQAVSNTLDNTAQLQSKHLRKVMPILKRYMATPKSYYLNSDMYHESLENRAAMLADFSDILIQYQKQLVSIP
jgi:hypothetical protein